MGSCGQSREYGAQPAASSESECRTRESRRLPVRRVAGWHRMAVHDDFDSDVARLSDTRVSRDSNETAHDWARADRMPSRQAGLRPALWM